MFLILYLASDGLHRIYDEALHIALEVTLKLILGSSILVELALGNKIKKSMQRYDVSFFKLTIILTVTLYRIIRKLHIDLFVFWNGWIILDVLFGACSHIAFRVDINAPI